MVMLHLFVIDSIFLSIGLHQNRTRADKIYVQVSKDDNQVISDHTTFLKT